jgi:hypothetical protein
MVTTYKKRVKNSVASQHIIELNGQRYDALTGALINTPVKPASKPKRQPTAVNMDGFARPTRGIQPSVPHHPAQKSQTLMRKAVRQPAKPQRPTAVSNTHTPKVMPSPSVKPHAIHGGGVAKSPLISKFGAPAQTAAPTSHAAPTQKTSQNVVAHTPRAQATRHDPIAAGLAKATSHEQPKAKKPRVHHRVAHKLHVSPRVVSTAAFAFAFLVIGGFFAYQNIPGMTMRLAAARSGVQGHLPGYSPSGFNLNGGIAYRPGQITINYKSNSDNRNFKVSQENSTWDSQTLLDNYVVASRKDYQTVQDKGKTIYIYDSSDATWVDGGIWYRIEGDSSLNSDQLLRLAASL